MDNDPGRAENAPVANFDLRKQADQESLKAFVQAESSALVHVDCAPSYGTASKAREKPVTNPLIRNPPKPLRSTEKPDGLDGLAEKDQARVDSANASYEVMVDLVLFLIGLGISVSINECGK